MCAQIRFTLYRMRTPFDCAQTTPALERTGAPLDLAFGADTHRVIVQDGFAAHTFFNEPEFAFDQFQVADTEPAFAARLTVGALGLDKMCGQGNHLTVQTGATGHVELGIRSLDFHEAP